MDQNFLALDKPFSKLLISHKWLEETNCVEILTTPDSICLIINDSSTITVKVVTVDGVIISIDDIITELDPFPYVELIDREKQRVRVDNTVYNIVCDELDQEVIENSININDLILLLIKSHSLTEKEHG
jgi:hypothetical protein